MLSCSHNDCYEVKNVSNFNVATVCNRSSSNSNSLINNNSFSCSSSSNISFNTSVGSWCDNTSCKLKCVSVDHSYSKSSIYSDKLKLYIENTKSSIAELKLVFINVCGLCSKLKFPDFINFVNAHNVVNLAKTKLDCFDKPTINGYTFIGKKNRKNCRSKSGGIGLFVKDSLYKILKF